MEDSASPTDSELRAAYQRTNGKRADPAAAALIVGIERRALDMMPRQPEPRSVWLRVEFVFVAVMMSAGFVAFIAGFF